MHDTWTDQQEATYQEAQPAHRVHARVAREASRECRIPAGLSQGLVPETPQSPGCDSARASMVPRTSEPCA